MTLLSNDDFFRTVYDKVTTLIIHALLLPNDSSVIFIVQMALRATDHYWNLAELYLLCFVLLDELTGLVTILVPFSLFNVDVNLGVNLVSHVSNSRLMREVGVDFTRPWVLHHRLGAGIDLSKHYLIADVVVLGVDSPSW